MQMETTHFPREIFWCKRKQQISRGKSADANGNNKFPAGNRLMQMETTNFPQEIGRCKLHQRQLKAKNIVYFFRFMYHLLKNSHKYNEHLIKYLVIIYACKYNKNKYKMQNKKEFFSLFFFSTLENCIHNAWLNKQFMKTASLLCFFI